MRFFLAILCVFVFALRTTGQVADFELPAIACKNETITFINNSTGAQNYVWDFCHDGIEHATTAELVASLSTATAPVINIPEGLELVNDNGFWYGFALGRNNNSIYRVNFGTDLVDFDSISYIPNPGGLLNLPTQLKVVQQDGEWYGIITNFGNSHIVRIGFGSDLANNASSITATDLGTFGTGTGPRGLDVVPYGNGFAAIASYWLSDAVALINFNDGIDAAPVSFHQISNGAAVFSDPIGISLLESENEWYALLGNYTNGKTFILDFDGDLFTDPDYTEIGTVGAVRNARLLQDGMNYYGLITTTSGLVTISLHQSLATIVNPIVGQSNNFSGAIADPFGFVMVKDSSNWKGFVLNQGNGKIHSIAFEDNCSASGISLKADQSAAPTSLKYQMAGDYFIELIAYNSSGGFSVTGKTITIEDKVAPAVSMVTEGECLGSQNAFTGVATDPNTIVNWSWDFGDGVMTNGQAVNHTFTTIGNYLVSLTIESQNGCENQIDSVVHIYNPPVADFDLPTANLCSNASLEFTNQTVVDPLAQTAWSWYIDETSASNEEHLLTTISGVGQHTITLRSSLSGCFDEIEKLVTLQSGPLVDFTYANNCFGEFVQFKNLTEGQSDSFVWDFGNGVQNDFQWDADYKFESSGTYNVMLRITNENGCVGEKELTLTTANAQLVDFINNSVTENLQANFTGVDITGEDDEITSWRWNIIGEQLVGSTVNFTFQNPGEEEITLLVETAQGCSDTIEKVVVIEPSSIASIIADVPGGACVNEQISFYNDSRNAVKYLWDFCHDDIGHVKNLKPFVTLPQAMLPEGIETVYDKGKYYTFITNRDNRLLRIIHPEQLIPVSETDVVDLEVDGLNSVMDVEFAKQNEIWFAFILNFGSGSITRLRFGNGLDELPDENTSLGSLNCLSVGVRGLSLVRDHENWFALTVNFNDGEVHIVSLGSDLSSISDPEFIEISNPLIKGPLDIAAISDNQGWHGLVTSQSGNKLIYINFGQNLETLPSEGDITSIVDVAAPFEVELVKEGLNYKALVTLGSGHMHFINFGESMNATEVLEVVDLGNLAGTNMAAANLFQYGNSWKSLVVDYNTNSISIVTFETSCSEVSEQMSIDPEPVNFFMNAPGLYPVTLFAFHDNGSISSKIDTIHVKSELAPVVDFEIGNSQCISESTQFTSRFNEGVTAYQWWFGDNTSLTSDKSSVSHTYNNSGFYKIQLRLTHASGCKNLLIDTIQIFNQPVAQFDLPDVLDGTCTNQRYEFINTSVLDSGAPVDWRWTVNGNLVSEEENLQYTFENVAQHQIELHISLAGCSNEISIPFVINSAGPKIDFEFTNPCADDSVLFRNTSNGGTRFQWRFNDEIIEANQVFRVYNSPGVYAVKLTNVDDGECQNSIAKDIQIFHQPLVDFTFIDLPFYCTHTTIAFTSTATNPEDGTIQSLSWNFGEDNAAAGENVEFTFSHDGDIQVSHTAVNTNLCAATKTKTINILKTPDAAFENGLSCVGVPTDFVGPDASDIGSFVWVIDDKTYNEKNPEHIFRNPGPRSVTLNVTALNGCTDFFEKEVTVPVPLTPAFSVANNCVGVPTILNDTTSGEDQIVAWEWLIDQTESFSGNPVDLTFNSESEKNVRLTVTTASGCTYVAFRDFSIVPAPEANFTVSSVVGTPPFPIAVTNSSENATLFNWSFGDGSFSQDIAPEHIYTEEGEFQIMLTASNEQGCEDSATKSIVISSPTPDVTVMAITTLENPDGSMKITVVLQNDGNTIIEDLPVTVDVSGNLSLRELVDGPFLPRSRVYMELGYGLNLRNDITFLCAEAELPRDVDPATNRSCIEFENSFIMMPVYPNPVKDVLAMQWISVRDEKIRVALVNSFGTEVWSSYLESTKGHNQHSLSVDTFNKGVYMLVLEAPDFKTTQRVLLTR